MHKWGGPEAAPWYQRFRPVGFGVDRTCVFTRTVFGPGFRLVRTGLHLVAMSASCCGRRPIDAMLRMD